MAIKGKKYTTLEEKYRLLRLYYESDDSVDTFCLKHGLDRSSMFRWIRKFGPDIDKEIEHGENERKEIEKQLRQEVLKLKIENERLKKKYMVRKTPDGKTEYIRLKAKNTK